MHADAAAFMKAVHILLHEGCASLHKLLLAVGASLKGALACCLPEPR